ncbi:hypothetical protein VCV18_009360 [Metarhizium anisopliae]
MGADISTALVLCRSNCRVFRKDPVRGVQIARELRRLEQGEYLVRDVANWVVALAKKLVSLKTGKQPVHVATPPNLLRSFSALI